MVIHYAISPDTECGVHITGRGFYTEDVKFHSKVDDSYYRNIQHTCDVEGVTCKRCKNSIKYKEAIRGRGESKKFASVS